MSFHGLASAIVISIAATLPMTASAHTQKHQDDTNWQTITDGGALYKKAERNESLSAGDYAFGQFHNQGSSFFDTWSFTLADSGNVSLNLLDAFIPLGGNGSLNESSHGNSEHAFGGNKKASYTGLLDNKWLTASLFDSTGTLLGTVGENGTLNVNNLLGGAWYTLTVSGKASGLTGGYYYGSLGVDSVAPVPLSDSLPFFMSAIAALAWRSRKAKAKTLSA